MPFALKVNVKNAGIFISYYVYVNVVELQSQCVNVCSIISYPMRSDVSLQLYHCNCVLYIFLSVNMYAMLFYVYVTYCLIR